MAVAALAPLLLLSGGQATVPHIPADCYLTSTYAYDTDTDTDTDTVSLIADLDEAQADLALQAKELTAHLADADAIADAVEADELRARTEAAHALSLPTAHRSTRGSTAHLTAYDTHGRLLAEATYGPPVQIFLNPTPADDYLQQSLTFTAQSLPSGKSCATSSS
jgi:hypothetical protein